MFIQVLRFTNSKRVLNKSAVIQGGSTVIQIYRKSMHSIKSCGRTTYQGIKYTALEMSVQASYRRTIYNLQIGCAHYENTPIQIYWKFHHQKNWKFSDKKHSDIFHISAQNIDCSTRENRLDEAVLTSTHNLCFWAERRKIMYTPVNPNFTV